MPVVVIHCLPKTAEQRERVARRVIEAVAEELSVEPGAVQVFTQEYADSYWLRGAAGSTARSAPDQ